VFIFELIIDLLTNNNRSRKRSFVYEAVAIIAIIVFIVAMILVTELG